MSANRFEYIETSRLLLRKPFAIDAQAIFSRYASNPEVTRYLGWPTHFSIEDTNNFIKFSDEEWKKWPVGPYLIERVSDNEIIGSTGLTYKSADSALTGYVLAKDAWGCGYATEALQAMIILSKELGLHTLYGLCHPDNLASRHVMEKCGFIFDDIVYESGAFPNLKTDTSGKALRLTKILR